MNYDLIYQYSVGFKEKKKKLLTKQSSNQLCELGSANPSLHNPSDSLWLTPLLCFSIVPRLGGSAGSCCAGGG